MNVKKEEQIVDLKAQTENNVNTGVVCLPESLSEEQALGKLQRYKTIFRCGCTTIKE